MSAHDPTERALAMLADDVPSPPPLPAALEAELQVLTPVPMRRPRRQLMLHCAVSLLYGAGLLAVLQIRSDVHELPATWMVGAALAWFVGFAVPCYFAIVPGVGEIMPRWRLAAIVSILASVGFVVLGLLVHPSGPSSVQYGTEQFLRGHVCLEIGLATALVPVVFGMFLLRGVLPVRSRWIAAAIGAGCGSLGGLVLHLFCHITDGLHVGVIHGGVVIVAAALSAALAPRIAAR